MKKILSIAGLAAFAVIAAFLIFSATKPETDKGSNGNASQEELTKEEAKDKITEGSFTYKDKSYGYSIVPTGRINVAQFEGRVPEEAQNQLFVYMLNNAFNLGMPNDTQPTGTNKNNGYKVFESQGKIYNAQAFISEGGIAEVRYLEVD